MMMNTFNSFENVYSGIQFNNKQNKQKLIYYLIIGRDNK